MDYSKLAKVTDSRPAKDVTKLKDGEKDNALEKFFGTSTQKRVADGMGKTFKKSVSSESPKSNTCSSEPSKGRVFYKPKGSESPKNNTPEGGESRGKVFKRTPVNDKELTQLVVNRVKTLNKSDRKVFYKNLMDSLAPFFTPQKQIRDDNQELYQQLSTAIDSWLINMDDEAKETLEELKNLEEFSEEERDIIQLVINLEQLPGDELADYVAPLKKKFAENDVQVPPFVLLKTMDSEDNTEQKGNKIKDSYTAVFFDKKTRQSAVVNINATNLDDAYAKFDESYHPDHYTKMRMFRSDEFEHIKEHKKSIAKSYASEVSDGVQEDLSKVIVPEEPEAGESEETTEPESGESEETTEPEAPVTPEVVEVLQTVVTALESYVETGDDELLKNITPTEEVPATEVITDALEEGQDINLSADALDAIIESVKKNLEEKGLKLPDSLSSFKDRKAQICDSFEQVNVVLPKMSLNEYRTLNQEKDLTLCKSLLKVADSTNLTKLGAVAMDINKLNILDDRFYKRDLKSNTFVVSDSVTVLKSMPIIKGSKIADSLPSEGRATIEVLDSRFGTLEGGETSFYAPFKYSIRISPDNQ